MPYKTLFKSGLLMLTALLLLVSCDKDFNQIGSSIIGDDHFGFELYSDATVNAFTQATAAVQSNNLPVNSLGIYNNPVFGKTKAGFVTQLQMAAPNPTFDPAYFVSMDSVVLTVPYFSHVTSTDASGKKYALDSINGSGPINLKVFESGYFMSDLDPSTNFESGQAYFTDQESTFDGHKVGSFLNDSSLSAENTEFVPSSKQFVTYTRNEALGFTKTANPPLSPRMSLHLNKDYFYSKILKAPTGKLINNSVFSDYFRGLYFQVADADAGSLMRLDFTKGDVTLYYTEYQGFNDPDTKKDPIKYDHDNDPKTPQVPKLVIKSYVLNLKGSTVNLVQHDPTGKNYAGIIAPRPLDPLPNDQRLYVKGGAGGSVAIIDLFGKDLHGADGITGDPNGVADELDIMRKNGWLINEANLTFYIDQNAEGMKDLPNQPGADDSKSEHGEPQRVFLFDVNNREPLYDFVTDISKGSNAKLSKVVLDGMIQTKNKRGVKYRVRITNHIRNLVKYADSTNVRLGLIVTESIGLVGNAKLKQPVDIPYPFKSKNARAFDRLPLTSVMNPLGTVLFGGNIPTDDKDYDKRLKLEIYYTKPKK